MSIPEDVKIQILRELEDEINSIKVGKGEKYKTFDELEGIVLNIGKKFERRLLEESMKIQEKEEKKTARSVGEK